ncbi:MAG: hypothetical protein A2W73_08345 [Deltaproteobacteria bacterium RIFCSPLOWO2_12_55_13]|nr:MAG: hypothetical protein A2W73_08345 [Deltaproteobacteria bacterium RIFCSPLOWO2_12_55_13]
MKAVRKGLENIRTLRSMVNNSMPMTSRGALMERARLNQEEERLWNELDRLRRRMGVIKNRLEEIEKIEAWLERFVEAHQSSSRSKDNGSTESTRGKRSNKEMILKY